jgi:hypothetical protein
MVNFRSLGSGFGPKRPAPSLDPTKGPDPQHCFTVNHSSGPFLIINLPVALPRFLCQGALGVKGDHLICKNPMCVRRKNLYASRSTVSCVCTFRHAPMNASGHFKLANNKRNDRLAYSRSHCSTS